MSSFYEEMESLKKLSAEQTAAAMDFQNTIMMVAGAGTGKTMAVIGRAKAILLPKEYNGLGADPGSLMMVTFTNKAAREMRERFEGTLSSLRENGVFGDPWIGTFHSISMKILRIEARHAGYNANFTILDDSDAREVAKEAAGDLGLDQFDIDEFFSNLEYAKARLLTPEMIIRKKAEIQAANEAQKPLSPLQERWNKAIHTHMGSDFPQLYKSYQDTLSRNNAVDFSDLINQVTLLFRNRPDIRDSWKSTFRHFIIDESQDMNPAQAAWLDQITGRGEEMTIDETTDMGLAFDDATAGNHTINKYRIRAFPRPTIAFVGDDDQAIYAFRGSDTGIMLNMNRTYEGLKLHYLTQSYRCQPNILSAANRLIAQNEERYDKEVVAADPNRKGPSVIVKEYKSYKEEFKQIADEVKEHIRGGGKPSEFGVLFRTRNAVREFAKFMREQGLPVTEGKASDIRKSAEVRDVMAYAGFLVNPDAEVLLRRVLNKPARGMGMASVGVVGTNARLKSIPFTEELRSVISKKIDIPDGGQAYKPAFVKSAQQFGYIVDAMRKKIAGQNAHDSLMTILKDTGYLRMIQDEVLMATKLAKSPESAALRDMHPRLFMQTVLKLSGKTQDADTNMEDLADAAGRLSDGMRRIANLALLLDQAENAASLETFVQDATLEMSETKDAPGVNVMTMHASKGLEFDNVRLPLWYQGMMPMSEEVSELEEGRRLAYVSLTRARNTLVVSYPTENYGAGFAMGKGGKTKMSSFIKEMIGMSNDVVHFSMYGKRLGRNSHMRPVAGTDIDFALSKPTWQDRNAKPAGKTPDFVWKKAGGEAETPKAAEPAPADLFSQPDPVAAPAPGPVSLFEDDEIPF